MFSEEGGGGVSKGEKSSVSSRGGYQCLRAVHLSVMPHVTCGRCFCASCAQCQKQTTQRRGRLPGHHLCLKARPETCISILRDLARSETVTFCGVRDCDVLVGESLLKNLLVLLWFLQQVCLCDSSVHTRSFTISMFCVSARSKGCT